MATTSSKVNGSPKLTATTRVLPRAATPEMLAFLRFVVPAPPVIGVQVAPPSVVRRRPARLLPTPPKLLKRPMPATSVWPVASVGSNSRAPMELAAWVSVSGVQLGVAAVALVVFQMPPLTLPA
jgi:hypothetical protein